MVVVAVVVVVVVMMMTVTLMEMFTGVYAQYSSST